MYCGSDGEFLRTFIVTRKLFPIESMREGLKPRDAPETKLLPLILQMPGTNSPLTGDWAQGTFRGLVTCFRLHPSPPYSSGVYTSGAGELLET